MLKTKTFMYLTGPVFATLCLLAAGSTVASAAPFTCGCGGTFGARTDVGLDTPVTGSADSLEHDWFEFQGLTAGALLDAVLTITNTGNPEFGPTIDVSLFTTSDVAISGDTGIIVDAGHSATLTGVVPLNGDVVVEVTGGNNRFQSTYSATLTPVPEPGTLTAMGLGLIGIGSMRFLARRNQRKG